jgi:hypothetical protein
MTTFGHRYAFHAFINVITAAAAYVDFMIGMYILKKMENSVSPSIRAASRTSTGKLLEFCLNIMIRNGVDIVGRINAQTVLSKCMLDIILNSGIIVATCGTIIASSKMEKTKSLCLS